MSRARALYAGRGAQRALVDGDGSGSVALVLRQGVYVRLGPEWVVLAEPGVPFGPLSVAVRGVDWRDVVPGLPVRIRAGRLLLGGQEVALGRMRGRHVRISCEARGGAVAVARAVDVTVSGLPPAPRALAPGISALALGRVVEAVSCLAGLGDGLTPAGDDVLAGYAGGRLALATGGGGGGRGAELSELARERGSALGLAYLRCAEQGELPEGAARLLSAICRGSVIDVRERLGALRAWGASSGVALGWGITAAARWAAKAGFTRQTGGELWPFPGSGWGSTSSKTPRSSTLPRRTACSPSPVAMTPSSTPS